MRSAPYLEPFFFFYRTATCPKNTCIVWQILPNRVISSKGERGGAVIVVSESREMETAIGRGEFVSALQQFQERHPNFEAVHPLGYQNLARLGCAEARCIKIQIKKTPSASPGQQNTTQKGTGCQQGHNPAPSKAERSTRRLENNQIYPKPTPFVHFGGHKAWEAVQLPFGAVLSTS